MRIKNKIIKVSALIVAVSFLITSCQKKERPGFGEIILDPPPAEPPAYNDLKSFWGFENSLADGGQNTFTPTGTSVTYVDGINGKAAQIGSGGYILIPADAKNTYTNGYQSFVADTLAKLGSYTLSFWMKGVGPVDGGAQGLFSISNKNEFWGNLDLFLENDNNAADQSEAFLKVHMFNAGVASGNGEQWNEVKIPGALNKWTHIAVTYDGVTSKFTIFADGAPTSINEKVLTDGGTNYGPIKFNNVNGMVLGTYQFQTSPSLTSNHGSETWARSFNGALDQFRIYNRALSAAEITDLYTTKK